MVIDAWNWFEPDWRKIASKVVPGCLIIQVFAQAGKHLWYLNLHDFCLVSVIALLLDHFDYQIAPISPNAIIIDIILQHYSRKLKLLRVILNLSHDPCAMAPCMIVFRFDFQNLIDQLILTDHHLTVPFEQKPAMFPELKVLDFFIKRLLTKFHFMFKTNYTCQVTHFFHIPAVVICFTIRYQLLGQLICFWVEQFELDVFFERSELLFVWVMGDLHSGGYFGFMSGIVVERGRY